VQALELVIVVGVVLLSPKRKCTDMQIFFKWCAKQIIHIFSISFNIIPTYDHNQNALNSARSQRDSNNYIYLGIKK
jgi:hypothetical protein